MKFTRKSTEPDDIILIVRADKLPRAYEWIAPAKYQRIARAEADGQFVRATEFTPGPKRTEAEDASNARADDPARADERPARIPEEVSSLEPDAPHHPSAEPSRPAAHDRPWLRGIIALVLAACIFAAAFVSQSSYRDATKLLIARWVPERLLPQPR